MIGLPGDARVRSIAGRAKLGFIWQKLQSSLTTAGTADGRPMLMAIECSTDSRSKKLSSTRLVAWLNLPKAERNKLRREMHTKSNRFQQLHDKHEAARLEAVLVEIEVTETKPPLN